MLTQYWIITFISLWVGCCVYSAEETPRKIGDEHWRQGNDPLTNSDIEHLARGVAYQGGATAKEMQSDAKLATHLTNNGLKLLDSFGGSTDAQAMLLKDTRTNQVYVVFRGSEFDKLSLGDAYTDANALTKQGVGANQYSDCYKKLNAWAAEHSGNITVTGHSLGGALAQRFIADHPEDVKRAVLFNAPGIDRYHAEKTAGKNLPPIDYYRNKNDVVDHTGYHLRGQVYTAGGGTTSTLNAGSVLVAEHRGQMLQGDKGVVIQKTSFDDWQRGMFGKSMTDKESQFRIALHEKSDEMLQNMLRLENDMDHALRKRDYKHSDALLAEYKSLKTNLATLLREASVTLPENPNNPLLPDKQVLDLYGRRKEIERNGIIAYADKSMKERTADKASEKSNTPDAKIIQNLSKGSGVLDSRDKSITTTLKPPQKKTKPPEKKEEPKDILETLAALTEEGEKELNEKHTVELTQALEKEGFTELQSAAYAKHNADVMNAKNSEDLMNAILAALKESGDYDYDDSTSTPSQPSQPKQPHRGGAKPRPEKNKGNKGTCTKPCRPKKK